MLPDRGRPSTTTLLAGAAVGVYLLVVAGATAALADAARACPEWPVCGGSLTRPGVLVAMGHRALAAVVGVVVLATAVAVFRRGSSRRVRATALLAVVLFPAQALVGALLATRGAAAPLPAVHLGIGLAIFGTLVLSLAWHLERETGEPSEEAAGTAPVNPTTVATGAVADPGGPGNEPVRALENPGGEPEYSRAGEPAPTTAQNDPARADTHADPARADTHADPARADTHADPARADTSAVPSRSTAIRERLLAYVRLTKPRLMWLLCLVAGAGMALAAGPDLTVRTVVLTLSGGVLAIGASGTFNHVLERDRDQQMRRTADRPLATHQVPVANATAFGTALAVASLAVFLQLNLLVAGLGFAAILFYTVVYTLLLKPNTVQNTVIGGAAGALPAVIGWAAATGRVGLTGLALAALVFAWTPAHFYNLALAYKEDYASGGFPMMPVVRGDTETRKHILLWLGTTLAAAGGLLWVTDLGFLVAGTTVLLGAGFLWAVLRLHREQTEAAAFRAFHASNAFLGAVLVAVVVDALVL
ncbi:MAG: heme o synthase [Haloarculaceae archaeon]